MTSRLFLVIALMFTATPVHGVPVPPPPLHLQDAALDARMQALIDKLRARYRAVDSTGPVYDALNAARATPIGSVPWLSARDKVAVWISQNEAIREVAHEMASFLEIYSNQAGREDRDTMRVLASFYEEEATAAAQREVEMLRRLIRIPGFRR